MDLPRDCIDVLGAAMYPKVYAVYPDISNQLIGMLLQLSFVEIIQLIRDEEKLGAKIEEMKRMYDANKSKLKQSPSAANTSGQAAIEKDAKQGNVSSQDEFFQAMQNLQILNSTDPEAAAAHRQALGNMLSVLIIESMSNITLSTKRYESTVTAAQTDTKHHNRSLEHRRARLQVRLRTLGDVVTMVQAAAPPIYDAMHGQLWDDVAGIKKDVKELKNEIAKVKEREKEVAKEAEKKWFEERESWKKVGAGVTALGKALGFQVEKKG